MTAFGDYDRLNADVIRSKPARLLSKKTGRSRDLLARPIETGDENDAYFRCVCPSLADLHHDRPGCNRKKGGNP